MIEQRFDIRFVAAHALREKQIQQNYRPVIAVHKWFARRPGTLFRGILLSEFADEPLPQAFYSGHDFADCNVLDPFMGGGTTLLEANRLGFGVTGMDVNPMSFWIVREEIETLDVDAYRRLAAKIRARLEREVGSLYRTACQRCHSPDAHTKYFLWVKTRSCGKCMNDIDLFPSFLVAEDVRHPLNVFACWNCRQLFESPSRNPSARCSHCGSNVRPDLEARRGRCTCSRCGEIAQFPQPEAGPPPHRLFAIEYHCPTCKPSHAGRFFKAPDERDLRQFREAERRLNKELLRYVPEDSIPNGDETERLHRWGYREYRQMFNSRQLLGLELLCREIAAVDEVKVRRALSTNLSDLLRYQNMLCRYDTMALKSLDVFSVHGFPVGQIQCESNILGIAGRAGAVGSGGWLNITEKFAKAKDYCARPFEIRHEGTRKVPVYIPDEWIGEERNGSVPLQRRPVNLRCASAMNTKLPSRRFDAVLTDPPYFGNVQYAELMDFCYVWLRKLVGKSEPAFASLSTRNRDELTANASMGRGFDHFTDGLSRAFQNAGKSLKLGAPFVFTYHHNKLEAYLPVGIALLDAQLVCSASLPCPAEMGASIHISGTGSSVVDTVFVCRTTGKVPKRWLVQRDDELARLICSEVGQLRDAGVKVTAGDIRCITFGHLIRLAVWHLRSNWKKERPVVERAAAISDFITMFGGPDSVQLLVTRTLATAGHPPAILQDRGTEYKGCFDEVSF